MTGMIRTLFLSVFLMTSPLTHAATIGSFEFGDASWSPFNGASLVQARNSLSADGHTVVNVGVGDLATNLQSVDILYLPFNGVAPFSGSAVAVMENFVANGNHLVVQTDFIRYNNLLALFGAQTDGNFTNNSGISTILGPSAFAPITQGAFGTVNSMEVAFGFVSQTLPAGALELDTFGYLAVMDGNAGLPTGYGSVVLLGDVNMFDNARFGLADNETLWRNIFADARVAPVPLPAPLFLLLSGLCGFVLLSTKRVLVAETTHQTFPKKAYKKVQPRVSGRTIVRPFGTECGHM